MITDDLALALDRALDKLGVDPRPPTITIERPANRDHGDFSSNVAMVSAKRAGRQPRELASDLVDLITADPPAHVELAEVAGPGFVNFRLANSWLHDVLTTTVDAGVEHYARLDVGAGQRVDVEFVSANPTGPLHAGHARGAIYGDALVRLLERCGYEVHREFYLNDRGVQMEMLGKSIAARAAGRPVPEDGYHGDYVGDWAAGMPADADPLEWGYQQALADQRAVLERLDVRFDTWFSERSMVASGAIDQTLADLRERGAVFDADGAVWLRSTEHGDDKDRVLVKSDGEFTYLLPDIAYHRDKLARGFDLLIDVWGADHHGYVPRMKAAFDALGHDRTSLEVVITQLVDLERGGQPVRMAKRAGEFVALSDVLDLLGPDAARVVYLLQSVDSRQTFDIERLETQSAENPVYYVQYAHARIASIGRRAAERGIVRKPIGEVDLGLLVDERELDVLRNVYELPNVLEAACADRAPHRVMAWIRELAASYHRFQHDCPVFKGDVDPALTQARLWLVEAARIALVIGLDLLGVSAPQEMRRDDEDEVELADGASA